MVTALSVSGSSDREPFAAEEAPADAPLVPWTPPAPEEVPLDCTNGTEGMQFAPAPPIEPALVPAPDEDAPPQEVTATVPGSNVRLNFPTLEGLTGAMTSEALLGWPEQVIGRLHYAVADQQGEEATIIGKLGDKRLILAPALRQLDGSWRWRDARPVRQPHGAWIMQGTSIICDDVWERV